MVIIEARARDFAQQKRGLDAGALPDAKLLKAGGVGPGIGPLLGPCGAPPGGLPPGGIGVLIGPMGLPILPAGLGLPPGLSLSMTGLPPPPPPGLTMPTVGGIPSPPPGLPPPPGHGLPLPPGMGMPPGMPGAAGLNMGQFDLLAHLHASARMNAAMAAAAAPPEAPAAEVPELPPAFDKQALLRLAQRACEAEEEEEEEPPPPPPAVVEDFAAGSVGTSAGSLVVAQPVEVPVQPVAPAPVSAAPAPAPAPRILAAAPAPVAPTPASATAARGVAEGASSAANGAAVVTHPGGGLFSGGAEPGPVSMTWAAAKLPVVERVKKDASSVATMMKVLQDNAARGRASDSKLRQPATSGVGAGGGGSATAAAPAGGAGVAITGSTGAGLEELLLRLEGSALISAGDRKQLEDDLLAALTRLDASKAADLIARMYASEVMRSAHLLHSVTRVLLPTLPRLGSPHLIRTLGVLACWTVHTSSLDSDGKPRFAEELRNFYAMACSELSLRLMDIVPRDLAQLATALSMVGVVEDRFFTSLARAAVARTDRFTPEEIASVMGTFSRASLHHTDLNQASARCLRAGLSASQPPDVARVAAALAVSCTREAPAMKAAADHLHRCLARGIPVGAEDLCGFVWSCCCMGFYHEPFFQAVFGALANSASLTLETMCQLYETHLALKAFCQESYSKYELKGEVVKALRSQYKKCKGGKNREVRLERASEKLHKDMADILRVVVEDSVSRQYQTELGFTVDLAVTKRRGSSTIAVVEVDGPHSLLRALDSSTTGGPHGSSALGGHAPRVRGSVLLKRNLLQKLGVQVVVVSEELWKNLGDSRDRRDLLRDMLRKVGVPKERLQ